MKVKFSAKLVNKSKMETLFTKNITIKNFTSHSRALLEAD